MSDISIEERRFSDREVREILKKAVAKSSSTALVQREGLSLAELRSIAEEVGIDPLRLEEAARAVALRESGGGRKILGGPTVVSLERKVEGVFDPEDTPEALSLIRRIMGRQGEVAEIHGSLEWTDKGDAGERYVTLSARDGVTTISSSANLTNGVVLTYLPAGIIGVISTAVGLIKSVEVGSGIALVFFLALIPVLYSVLRLIFGRLSGSESAKLQQVTEELAKLAKDSGEGEPGPQIPAAPLPPLPPET